jgi:hypothetical protein
MSVDVLLAESRGLVVSTHRLLCRTEQLIARSRRRLNPAFALSGSSEDEPGRGPRPVETAEWVALRDKIREALASKTLPPPYLGSVVRRGTEGPCYICLRPIHTSQLEREVVISMRRGRRRAVVHEPCWLLWRVEAMASAQRNAGA